MAIDGFQLIQQLADRVARLERRLDDTKTQPVESYTFSDIDDVLLRHKAVNKPEYGRYEISLGSYLFITIKHINDMYLVKLKGYNHDMDIATLMTEDASQVDIFIQAQKGNI